MRVAFLVLIFFIATQVDAQFTLRLIVNAVGAKKLDDIYVAGSFNNWNFKDEKYKLKPFGTSRRAIVLNNLQPGKYEFKFSRGSVEKVETTAKGEFVANHEANLDQDLSLNFDIPGWKDDFPDKPKPYTATAQVKIIDTAFYIPQLNRTRRIWAYLPSGYSKNTKSYPVLYMNDGQNLFNEQTAPFGEWGVDEALDTIIKQTGRELIVIGIDNGAEKRLTEYNPYDNKNYGKGEGNEYVDFLAKTLKPYIDKNFRTLTDPAHTYIAGSSLGALVSLYAIVKYPGTFGKAGIFSPSFWLVPQMFDDVASASLGANFHKFFFYAGGAESKDMVYDIDRMISIIEKKGHYETLRIMYPLGKHNEAAWSKQLPEFFKFLTR